MSTPRCAALLAGGTPGRLPPGSSGPSRLRRESGARARRPRCARAVNAARPPMRRSSPTPSVAALCAVCAAGASHAADSARFVRSHEHREWGSRRRRDGVCARGPTKRSEHGPSRTHVYTFEPVHAPCVCASWVSGRCLKIAARARVPFRAQLRPSLTRPYRAHPRQPVSRLVEAWVATTGVLCGCPPAPPPAKRSRRPRGRPRRHVDGCRACWRSLAADRDLPPPHDLSLATRCHHDLRFEHPSSGAEVAASIRGGGRGGAPCGRLRGVTRARLSAQPPRRRAHGNDHGRRLRKMASGCAAMCV